MLIIIFLNLLTEKSYMEIIEIMHGLQKKLMAMLLDSLLIILETYKSKLFVLWLVKNENPSKQLLYFRKTKSCNPV